MAAKTVRWGIQKFLNPVVSWDGGSIKLVATKKPNQRPNFTCKIRDCDDQIELDFVPNGGGVGRPYRGDRVTPQRLKEARASYRESVAMINGRRKKARLLANIFTQFADKLDLCMEYYLEEEKAKLAEWERWAKSGKLVTGNDEDF